MYRSQQKIKYSKRKIKNWNIEEFGSIKKNMNQKPKWNSFRKGIILGGRMEDVVKEEVNLMVRLDWICKQEE